MYFSENLVRHSLVSNRGLNIASSRSFLGAGYFFLGAIACFASLSVAGSLFLSRSNPRQHKEQQRAIPSPLETLVPDLYEEDRETLPYRPDTLPGGREVDTPYGRMMVYEWGRVGNPRNKILLLGDDKMPASGLASVAYGLVDHGYRVMLMDYWGRGYSDAPLNVAYDKRLYTTQILNALASSDTAYWFSHGFTILGHSFGGNIAMSFAAHYPHLVRDIVLVAPTGIVRSNDRKDILRSYQDLYLHSYLPRSQHNTACNVWKAVSSSIADTESTASDSEHDNPDAHEVIRWQFSFHSGFVHAFAATAACISMTDEHEDWRKVCDMITGRSQSVRGQMNYRDRPIHVILGLDDQLVHPGELYGDLLAMMAGLEHPEQTSARDAGPATANHRNVKFDWVISGHDCAVVLPDWIVRTVTHWLGSHAEADLPNGV